MGWILCFYSVVLLVSLRSLSLKGADMQID